MLYFKSCPRCKSGTVQLESDFYGSYLSCLNCGFERSARSVRKIEYDEMKGDGKKIATAIGAVVGDELLAIADEPLEDDDEFDDDLDVDEDELIELERAVG
ncbi:MAG: hypothetical protein O3C69_04385 [Chloroflexi bacterium]|nr:hypothetical protein [Chloroflexota bacterium]